MLDYVNRFVISILSGRFNIFKIIEWFSLLQFLRRQNLSCLNNEVSMQALIALNIPCNKKSRLAQ